MVGVFETDRAIGSITKLTDPDGSIKLTDPLATTNHCLGPTRWYHCYYSCSSYYSWIHIMVFLIFNIVLIIQFHLLLLSSSSIFVHFRMHVKQIGCVAVFVQYVCESACLYVRCFVRVCKFGLRGCRCLVS